MSVVISLCDYTGNFAQPWVEAGYDAILVDPQHGMDSSDFRGRGVVHKLAKTVAEALPDLAYVLATQDVTFVAAFPPCTDLAVSGAKHFASKREADPLFQAKAIAVAEQCRTFAATTGAPYLVENPVSVLASVFGKSDHTFNPYDYTGFEPADNYRKKTCLWTGNGFVMPPPTRDTALGDPDDRIHKAPPGPDRANFRSATPMGFARAVFAVNTQIVEAVA